MVRGHQAKKQFRQMQMVARRASAVCFDAGAQLPTLPRAEVESLGESLWLQMPLSLGSCGSGLLRRDKMRYVCISLCHDMSLVYLPVSI